MSAFLLGLSYGGNLTPSAFCPKLFRKIGLDNQLHACYSLLMFRHSPHSLTLSAVFVWWFAVLSPNGEIVFSHHRDKATCETARKAYARVRSLTVTTCQVLNNQQEETSHHGWKS